MSQYYFDGQGKNLRPRLSLAMARAVNSHLGLTSARATELQRRVAAISEMIHTSSLLHDDVIDNAEIRRGKVSVNRNWSPFSSIQSGVYILAVSQTLLARTENPDVIEAMNEILNDLVVGEFQQLASSSQESDRFEMYIEKCYNKTASLMANSCKSVAILANEEGLDTEIAGMAYSYGRNIGIAFQIMDDLLDFTASEDSLGKPSGADLSLGIATAPVLFAAQEFPELNDLIVRRFRNRGDVDTAWRLVTRSRGLQRTEELARGYRDAAMESIVTMGESEHKEELRHIAHMVINREK